MLLLQNIVEKENISQKEAKSFFPLKAQDTVHDFRLSQTKDWHFETTIAVISDSTWLFHNGKL